MNAREQELEGALRELVVAHANSVLFDREHLPLRIAWAFGCDACVIAMQASAYTDGDVFADRRGGDSGAVEGVGTIAGMYASALAWREEQR